MLITLAYQSAWSADVVVDAEPATPVRDIVKNLLDDLDPSYLADAPAFDGTLVYLGDRPLDLNLELSASGIHDGTVLWLHTPGPAEYATEGLVTIRAVAGSGAGRIWCLGAGEHRLGSAPGCTVTLGDEPVAATVTVSFGAAVRLHAAADGVLLDREPVPDGDVLWNQTAQLQVGDTLLEAHPVRSPDAMIEQSPESEFLDYNRPPRLLPPLRPTKFRMPAEPRPPGTNTLPWLAAILPAGFGVVMATAMHNPMYLMMAGMSPVMLISNWFTGRRQGRRGHRGKMAEHLARVDAVEAEISAALDLELGDRRTAGPDPAELLIIATGPHARLWERRRTDPDHLVVRVGTADLPSGVTVETPRDGAETQPQHREVRDVPVAFSIVQAGVVGIAGRDEWPRHLARWLTGQLAVLQSPRDLQLYVLTDPGGGSQWGWTAWLPHTRPLLGQQTLSLLGTDAETIARRVAELIELIDARQQARLNAGANAVSADPHIVVVLDGARRLRALPGVVNILLTGPAVGVYSICVDSDERTLPEECTTVVVGGAGLPTTLRQQRAAQIDGIRVDDVIDRWYGITGRRLAPVRDVSDNQNEAALPSSARLLEVINLEDPSPAAISARWSSSPRSTRAVVGYSVDGPFALDLVQHGPHGLVAGTTGSGKSEFLQTVVASLAVANKPDGMNFVLVDYKGGAAFKDCVNLPHTVGMVTDLDTHLVERALTSLGAELTHREHLLAAAGAKDLEDYIDYAARRPGLAPIPRLLIVIDEFASMARELPDFVTGLVNVAQRGRSLGIHLILATQRPSGVVSAEIRANTNLRVALRVTDAGESTDVIDAREAASISASHPGRAYARLGHSSLIPFQTGRVGGRRPQRDQVAVIAPFLHPVGWQDLGRPVPQRPRGITESEEATDLSVLVSAIRQTNDMLGLPAQRRPWLPALPSERVVELPAEPVRDERGEPTFAWAIQDLPHRQRQEPLTIDLSTFGHLHIVGAPRSGRSQALRTIAAAAASASSVTDLHLYGLDCGNGALLPMTKLPHCGAVVQRSDTERAIRLLNRLHQEVLRRQRLLGEGGFADLTEQRTSSPAAERLPHIMLLLDRWEGFMGTLSEHDNGALTDLIFTLSREGASAGVHLVIAGDHMLLSGRVSSLCDEKLVLRLSDRGDATMAGLNPRKIPENLRPGRGYRAVSAIEVQVALVAADPSGPAQVAAMHALSARLTEREAAVPRAMRPGKIALMPTQLTFDEAWEKVGQASPGWALLGVGGDELEPLGMDLLGDLPTFLIAGPSRSGRSTALGVMAESLLRGGVELVIGAPLRTPLQDLAGRPGVRGIITGDAPREEEFAELVDPGDGPVALLIDDAESWRDLTARDWLRQLIRRASGSRRAVVIAGEVSAVAAGFSGWQVEVKKNRRGALLSPPTLSAGDLIGARLTRANVAERVVPGVARVHLGDGTLQAVQIPLLEPAGAGR